MQVSENFDMSAAMQNDGLDILDMLREIGPGENGFGNDAYNLDPQDFGAWLQSRINMSHGIGLDPRYVPMTTYWLRCEGKPVGLSKLRTRLTDALREIGGHIGFCIRPTARGKGHAKTLLRLTLLEARLAGLKDVLLTCFVNNTSSWHTIEACGGHLDRIANEHRYYWIHL